MPSALTTVTIYACYACLADFACVERFMPEKLAMRLCKSGFRFMVMANFI